MNLKTRLYLGYAIFALLVAITGGASMVVFSWLSNEPAEIIKANYRSIAMADRMLEGLEQMRLSFETHQTDSKFESAKNLFDENLFAAENNITEIGEKEILIQLRRNYELLLQDPTHASLKADSVRTLILNLHRINEEAMFSRIDRVKSRTRTAEYYIGLVILASLVLACLGIWRVSPLVITPLNELSEKISEISNRKYSVRLDVKANDEIGKVANSFNQMAARLEEYEQSNVDQLTTEKKRAEAIVHSFPDGVLVLSPQKNVVLTNSIANELLGFSESELLNRDLAALVQTNNLVAELLKDLDNANPSEEYLRIYFRGKEEFFIKEIVRVHNDENNLGYVILLKNVTDFKTLDDQKSGFVATVSHELRTPLSAINMSLRLLEDDRLQGDLNERKKLIETMKIEVKRLLRIVNELLLLSKTTTPKNAFHFEKIKIEQLFDAALTPTLLQFEEKKIQFSYSFSNDTPEFEADLGKLSWVIINLLNNAVKFTPENGTVTLTAFVNNQNLIIQVKDSGIGIAPQYQEKIFEKFFQVPFNDSANSAGAGLGLSISKEIIFAHKGTIEVTSEPGFGSTFTVSIPLSHNQEI